MGCGNSKQTPVSQEVLNLDTNKDGLLSKDEVARFVERNEKLYAMLSVNLSRPEEQCREIATEVAYQMSKKSQSEDAEVSMRDFSQSTKFRKPTVEEFQSFLDFLEKPNGQQEFFHRTVFATFDTDKSGYLENNELDQFLDVFYQAGSIFAGDVRLPPKKELKKSVMRQLDTNGDGKLDFSELRVLISGGARAGLKFDTISEEKEGKNGTKKVATTKKKKKKAPKATPETGKSTDSKSSNGKNSSDTSNSKTKSTKSTGASNANKGENRTSSTLAPKKKKKKKPKPQ